MSRQAKVTKNSDIKIEQETVAAEDILMMV